MSFLLKLRRFPELWNRGSTSAPQGIVLSPFLFTIYPSDFRHNTGTCHFQKFSDDFVIVSYISEDDEQEYRGVVGKLCPLVEGEPPQAKHRQNRRAGDRPPEEQGVPNPHTIQEEEVEIVDSYNVLGVHSSITGCGIQEGAELHVFLAEAQVLSCVQQSVGYIIPVHGCQHTVFCSGVLKWWNKWRAAQGQQAGKKGQQSDGTQTGQFGGRGEEDKG